MDFWEWLQQVFQRSPNQNPDIARTLNSSFVQDTLIPLAGGNVSIRQAPLPGMGLTNRLTNNITLDPNAVSYRDTVPGGNMPGRYTVSHEIGHVIDNRNSIPGFSELADIYFKSLQSQGYYSGGNFIRKTKTRDEFEAELFVDALDLLKRAEAAPSPEAGWDMLMSEANRNENQTKGLGAAALSILNHPMYASHPLNRIRQGFRPTRGPSPF